MAPRFTGKLRTWNDDRGFGFIAPSQGGDEIFVHIKSFVPRSGRPLPDEAVSFEVELGPQGRKRAKNVEPIRRHRAGTASPRRKAPPWGAATLFAIPVFLVIYLAVAIVWKPPAWLAAVYVGASVVTFLMYAADKSAAKQGRWRTQESTLHVLALVGGWPGALLAQQVFRHKSAKAAFRSVFWITVALNVLALVLLSSPFGRSLPALQ